MKYFRLIALLVTLPVCILSCKNEGGDAPNTVVEDTAVSKEAITKEEKKQINSVLTRAMSTPELKTFVSSLVTTKKIDLLSTEDGPFTLLAPSNEAFAKMDKATSDVLFNIKNLSSLDALVNSHIYSGDLDSAAIVKKIAQGNGSFTLKTTSGATMTVFKEGSDILFEDSNGRRAVLGKSDIKGSNGVVHVLDQVLFTD